MEIQTIILAGTSIALDAMRNPYKSWDRTDTEYKGGTLVIGPKDKRLALDLQKSGPEHAKHLRMIMVWARITAPRYWWQQFDTYRVGVEKISTSTMHTLMRKHLTEKDFEGFVFPGVIDSLNMAIDAWRTAEDPKEKHRIEMNVIRNLPQSFLQERTVMMSYAAIRNMYKQRKGHKLEEWAQFLKWADGLPNAWMINE